MTSYSWCVAQDEQGLSDAFSVWHAEYQREGLTSQMEANPRQDPCAGSKCGVQIVVYAESMPVATARLLLPNTDVARTYGWSLGLELGAKYDLGNLSRQGISLAEVTRFAVHQKYRGTAALLTLCRGLQEESRRRGVSHWTAGSTMSTDHDEDASIATAVARHKNLYSETWRVASRVARHDGAGRRKALYDERARAKAREGRWNELRLPPILQLYSMRLGARFMGEPTYDPRFRVYSLPLIVAVDDVNIGLN